MGLQRWAALLVALAGVIFMAQGPNLSPIRPDDAVSVQHQVRQDAAIEAIAANDALTRDRLDRLERHEDSLIVALVGLAVTQLGAFLYHTGSQRASTRRKAGA